MDIVTTTHATHAETRLVGRFDAHEARGFRSRITEAVTQLDPRGLLEVDLSQVVFLDSTALAELVRLTRASEEGGWSLRLVNPSVPVTVILELTGLALALPVVDRGRTVDEP